MEKHVRNQLANVATEPENNKKPEGEKPESEKLAATEIDNVQSIADIAQAIRGGDKAIEDVLSELTQNMSKFCDNLSDIQLRIANIETSLEQLQLSSITIFDKLAKIAMALVAFVAKFGTKKDEAEARDEVDAEAEVKSDQDTR